MPRVGNALRLARQHELSGARRCKCGHRSDEHRELPYGSEGYEPLKFHCDLCVCPNFDPAA